MVNRTPRLPGPPPRAPRHRRRRPRCSCVRRLADDLWEALVRPGRRLRAGRPHRAWPGASRVSHRVRGRGRRRTPTGAPARSRHGRRRLLERLGHVPLPAVHPASRPTRGPRPLPDHLRSRAGQRRRAHGGPPLHAGTAGAARKRRGIERAEVLLHVGPGTFKPVTVEDVRAAPGRAGAVPGAAGSRRRPSARTRERGGRVVAVGTTTTRALETAARDGGPVAPGDGETDLVIVPGLRVPGGRRPRDQLPPSALVPAAPGERLRGARARARGLPRGPAKPATASTATATRC